VIPSAAVFPGQGAQYVGMGRELAERFPEAREVFRRASDAAGLDLYRLCVEGPDDALRQTANTQPAILTASLACLATVPLEPACAAGLSLGEYTALVCAGAVSLEDAVRLVRLRGQYMQEACDGLDTMMAAVVGLALTVLGVLLYNRSAWPATGAGQWGLGLMVGGALGNIVERLRFGYVVDYVDVHVWPVFNLADTAIVVGAGLLLLALSRSGGSRG